MSKNVSRTQNRLNIIEGKLAEEKRILSSDRRVRGGFTDQCCLCGSIQKLQLSHIVPKWMFKWAKAEGYIVGSYRSLGIKTKEQDGKKHYLLCRSCEQFMGESEKYVADLMTKEDEQNIRKADAELSILEFHDLNSILIQRFLLGTLLRVHYAPSPPYHKYSLSVEYLESIKKALLHDIRNENIYPILANKFVSTVETRINPRAMVLASYSHPKGQCALFELLAAGWCWMIFLNFDGLCPAEFMEFCLRNDVPFIVPVGDIIDHRFINLGKFLTSEEKHKYRQRRKH